MLRSVSLKLMEKYALFCLPPLLLSCCSDMREHRISDVAEEEDIVLTSENDTPSKFVLVGSGRVDGEAKLILYLEGSPYQEHLLSGDVDFEWRDDWYSEELTLRYVPNDVTGGELVLKYDIY